MVISGRFLPMSGFSKEGGFEEGQAKSFGHRGRDDVGGTGHPVREIRVADDIEFNGEIQVPGEFRPLVVNGHPFQILGCESDGEFHPFGSMGCEEAEFA